MPTLLAMCPPCFRDLLQYVRRLEYEATPDYAWMRQQMMSARMRLPDFDEEQSRAQQWYAFCWVAMGLPNQPSTSGSVSSRSSAATSARQRYVPSSSGHPRHGSSTEGGGGGGAEDWDAPAPLPPADTAVSAAVPGGPSGSGAASPRQTSNAGGSALPASSPNMTAATSPPFTAAQQVMAPPATSLVMLTRVGSMRSRPAQRSLPLHDDADDEQHTP